MDLNAEAFDERLEKFELSNFVRREQVDLVVASNAWLDSETKEALKPADMETEEAEKVKEQLREKEEVEEGSWEEVRGLVSYWVYRMSTNLEGEGTGMAFVVCNRIGREGGESTLSRSSFSSSILTRISLSCRFGIRRFKLYDPIRRTTNRDETCFEEERRTHYSSNPTSFSRLESIILSLCLSHSRFVMLSKQKKDSLFIFISLSVLYTLFGRPFFQASIVQMILPMFFACSISS